MTCSNVQQSFKNNTYPETYFQCFPMVRIILKACDCGHTADLSDLSCADVRVAYQGVGHPPNPFIYIIYVPLLDFSVYFWMLIYQIWVAQMWGLRTSEWGTLPIHVFSRPEFVGFLCESFWISLLSFLDFSVYLFGCWFIRFGLRRCEGCVPASGPPSPFIYFPELLHILPTKSLTHLLYIDARSDTFEHLLSVGNTWIWSSRSDDTQSPFHQQPPLSLHLPLPACPPPPPPGTARCFSKICCTIFFGQIFCANLFAKVFRAWNPPTMPSISIYLRLHLAIRHLAAKTQKIHSASTNPVHPPPPPPGNPATYQIPHHYSCQKTPFRPYHRTSTTSWPSAKTHWQCVHFFPSPQKTFSSSWHRLQMPVLCFKWPASPLTRFCQKLWTAHGQGCSSYMFWKHQSGVFHQDIRSADIANKDQVWG